MKRTSSFISLRAMLFAALLAVAAWIPAGSIHAQSSPHPVRHFNGQIIDIGARKSGMPITLVLMTQTRTVSIRIPQVATLNARSAEAQVEGLALNDYAIVVAKKNGKVWVAQRIDYDVHPIGQGAPPATVSGTVNTATPEGRSFTMRLETGDVRSVVTTKTTKYQIDDVAIDSPPDLQKGDVVEVTMRHVGQNWVALDINIKELSP